MDNSKSLVNIKSLYKDEAKEINKNHKKLYDLMKKGVLIAFEIGEQLVNVQRFLASNDRNAFKVWAESNLEISPATIRNYIKLYDYFYDKPELLNTLTLMVYQQGKLFRILVMKRMERFIQRGLKMMMEVMMRSLQQFLTVKQEAVLNLKIIV